MFRDCMRGFLVHHLRQIPEITLEAAVERALRGEKVCRFKAGLKRGEKVEGYIDVRDFPWLIKEYWQSKFKAVFNGDRYVQDKCRVIVHGRNEVSHPGMQDIDSQAARAYLFHIREVLAHINHPDEARRAQELIEGIPGLTMSGLAYELGRLALMVDAQRSKIEDMDDDSERVHGLVKLLKDAIPSLNKRLQKHDEILDGLHTQISQRNVEHSQNDSVEQLRFELERVGRLVEGHGVDIKKLLDKIEHVDPLPAASEPSTPESSDDWGDQTDDDTEHPRIFPGARFYCAEEDCLFVAEPYAGTRRAWYYEHKADAHALEMRHEIIEL